MENIIWGTENGVFFLNEFFDHYDKAVNLFYRRAIDYEIITHSFIINKIQDQC